METLCLSPERVLATRMDRGGIIFISHAVADKELVDAFVDFLQTGCGVRHEEVFCSSLEGLTIPEGSSFVQFMEDSLREADFVIMIITPSYYESVFCVCELGATWILQHDNFPLLVPPLEWADLKAVLNPKQGAKINDPSDLANLLDRLKAIGKSTMSTARFELKKDAFIEKFKMLKVKGKTNVSAKEYEELKKKYDGAVKATLEYDEEIAKLKKQFDDLAAMKAPSDVLAVVLAGSNEPEQLALMIKAFKKSAKKLPNAALEAIFSETRGEMYRLPEYFGNETTCDAAQNAAERQFVKIDENVVTALSSHPAVEEVQNRLNELRNFIGGASEELAKKYQQDHSHQFSIYNRDFWEKNLGL